MNYQELGHSLPTSGETWAKGPRGKNAAIIARVVEHMDSVPYRVSLRWLFYRLLQDGTLASKDSYKSLKGLVAKARHSGFIQPFAIADEGRSSANLSGYHDSIEEWRDKLTDRLRDNFKVIDTMILHDPYVIVAFEAKAMQAQFEVYAEPYNVMLYPFGGDPSIPFKWQLSEHIKDRLDESQNVTLLYFGDLDPKGAQIGETAIRHVRKFLQRQAQGDAADMFLGVIEELGGDTSGHAKFNAYHVGLLQRHVDDFNIPQQPDKPGHYQWEALEDQQAAQLITDALDNFVDLSEMVSNKAAERGRLVEVADLLDTWEDDNV